MAYFRSFFRHHYQEGAGRKGEGIGPRLLYRETAVMVIRMFCDWVKRETDRPCYPVPALHLTDDVAPPNQVRQTQTMWTIVVTFVFDHLCSARMIGGGLRRIFQAVLSQSSRARMLGDPPARGGRCRPFSVVHANIACTTALCGIVFLVMTA